MKIIATKAPRHQGAPRYKFFSSRSFAFFAATTYILPCSNRIPGIKLEPFHESKQWLNVTDDLTRGLKINREDREQDDS